MHCDAQFISSAKIYDDLIQLIDEEEVFLYPVNELIAAELAVASPELRAQRLEVLNYWCGRKKGIVIAPIAALRRLLPPKDVWQRYQLRFRVGEQMDVEHCLKQFIAMGYERVSVVSTPGEFSVRGGIIDIYPLTAELPYRIELFDVEIESIRTFSVDDQRSVAEIDEVLIDRQRN